MLRYAAMEPFKGQNLFDFIETFQNDDCKAYLTNLKWHGGFKM